jgi:hypothetical protein
MINSWLTTVLVESYLKNGCGMSTRPDFYSARGATSSDLDDKRLERIYQAILKHKHRRAAKSFVRMVATLKVLSATDFLIALKRFERDGFRWNTRKMTRELRGLNGISYEDVGGAFGTMLQVLSDSVRPARDETMFIRGAFLARHGVHPPLLKGKGRDIHGRQVCYDGTYF